MKLKNQARTQLSAVSNIIIVSNKKKHMPRR